MSVQAFQQGIGLIGQRAPRTVGQIYTALVDATSPAGHLRLVSGSTWTDRVGGADFTLVNSPRASDGSLLSAGGGGQILDFKGGANPPHATLANFLEGAIECAFDVTLQIDEHPGAGNKLIIFNVGTAPQIGWELEDDGAGGLWHRIIREMDTGTVVWTSPAASVPIGIPVKLSLRFNSDATVEAFTDGTAQTPLTVASGTEGSSWVAIGAATGYLLVWRDGVQAPFRGRVSDFVWWEIASPQPSLAAFPGAEGGGALATGGRGGTVYVVTNRNNSGAGSFREAVEASGPRVVVFRVGGEIPLSDPVFINNPDLTILGQTAPGGGVVLDFRTQDPVRGTTLQASNIIIYGMKYRTAKTADAVGMLRLRQDAHDICVGHCSIVWGDDHVGVWSPASTTADQAPRNVTLQNNIIAETFKRPDSDAATALLIGGDGHPDQMTDIDVIRNLIVHTSHRMPLFKAKTGRIINNIIYNKRLRFSQFQGATDVDIIGNIHKKGPASDDFANREKEYAVLPDSGTGGSWPPGDPSIFIEDNQGPTNLDPTVDNWDMITVPAGTVNDVDGDPLSLDFRRVSRLAPPSAGVEPTLIASNDLEAELLPVVGAYRRIDENGSWVNNRDALDDRLITEFQNGTHAGSVPVESLAEVGGWVTISDSAHTFTDTSGDGIPDDWLIANGFDHTVSQAGTIIDGKWSLLEHYAYNIPLPSE